MKTTTAILALTLLTTTLAFVPLASAELIPPCTPSGGSVVNQVQYRVTCWVDKTQEIAYEIYCDLACP